MCNCHGGKAECPLDGKCLTEGIICKAEIDGTSYYGSAGGTFKKQYYTHKHIFENSDARQRALSSYVHDRCLNYKSIKWSKHKKAHQRPKGAKFCELC